MGVTIDTIAGVVTAGATNPKALAAVTMAQGDSLQVRSFSPQGWARLEAVFFEGTAKSQTRILSPEMHDNVTGLTWGSAETPAVTLMPPFIGQPLRTGDTLVLETGCAAATSAVVALSNYYFDPTGPIARLHSWGDISGIIKNLKSMEVDCTTSATIGAWSDTAINTTDLQLHANTDYAVLGYQVDTAVACVGIKGQATANLRICGPGPTSTLDITSYFITMSDRHGTPHIPVISSANQGATYVSTLANTASVATKVYLQLAELSAQVTP